MSHKQLQDEIAIIAMRDGLDKAAQLVGLSIVEDDGEMILCSGDDLRSHFWSTYDADEMRGVLVGIAGMRDWNRRVEMASEIGTPRLPEEREQIEAALGIARS